MSRRFTPEERATLWRGWKSGLTLKEIGESLNRRGCSVLWVLRREGGFEPRTRIRAARTLQPQEREEISRGMAAGLSMREIARQRRQFRRSPKIGGTKRHRVLVLSTHHGRCLRDHDTLRQVLQLYGLKH